MWIFAIRTRWAAEYTMRSDDAEAVRGVCSCCVARLILSGLRIVQCAKMFDRNLLKIIVCPVDTKTFEVHVQNQDKLRHMFPWLKNLQ